MCKAACLDKLASWLGEKEPGITGSREPGLKRAGSAGFGGTLFLLEKWPRLGF